MNQESERQLLGLLRDIDARLEKERLGEPVTLFLFGGAAAVIAWGSRRGTVDIDAYLENDAIEIKLIKWAGRGSELEEKHGLYFQSANTSLMLIEDPQWKERSVEILIGELRNIRIKALSKEDLILSKLSRYNDRDRQDIQFLCDTYKINAKELIANYESARLYYVGRLETLDATFNIILEEHFGLKPRSFGRVRGR